MYVEIKKREDIEKIMKSFEKELSADIILTKTATAINDVMKRAISNKEHGIKISIKKKTNLKGYGKGEDGKTMTDMLRNVASVKPYANKSNLWAGIYISTRKLPVMWFNPKNSKSGVTFSVYKSGGQKKFSNAFKATLDEGHTGIFGRGRYLKKTKLKWTKASKLSEGIGMGKRYTKQEVDPKYPRDKKDAMTEAYTTSPFNMTKSKQLVHGIQMYIDKEAAKRVMGILQGQVDKIKKY